MADQLNGCTPQIDADDKYAKFSSKNAPAALAKYNEALEVAQEVVNDVCPVKTAADCRVLLRKSFAAYTVFLIWGGVVYTFLGGSLLRADTSNLLRYVEIVVETLGLLHLRHKILVQGGVAGISGMTMIMYLVVYGLRLGVNFPYKLSLVEIDNWTIWILMVASFVIVLNILRFIFKTYRNSYQDDIDTLPIKYLIPASVVLAGLLHPEFHSSLHMGSAYTFAWTSCLYLDVVALMPQVVMMAKSGGKIAAPICHFVAATAFSRVMDLCFWFSNFNLVDDGSVHRSMHLDTFKGEFGFSAGLIVFFHILHLLLVADFMYYYVKARLAGDTLSDGLEIALEEV